MATTKSKKKPKIDKEDLRFEFNYQNSGNDDHCDRNHSDHHICCGWPLVRRLVRFPVARWGLVCPDGINVPVVGETVNGRKGSGPCRL